MTGGSFDRRAFLAWSGSALVVAALAACGSDTSGPKVDIGALRDLVPNRKGVEQIGKYAVKAREVGGRPRAIAAALAPDASAAWIGTTPAPAIRKHLRARIADDFEQSRIIDVAGWQLPLTEARVAALVYLAR